MTSQAETEPQRGYGNIYTPHAGSMIIQVQRESGLANRTIIFTRRQVRMLRLALKVGGGLLFIGIVSWIVLATQAARVPFLTRRVTALQRDVKRVDTLQIALVELDRRFQQVQRMLGASTETPRDTASSPPAVPPTLPALSSVTPTPSVPESWPLETDGRILPGESRGSAAGIDIAVPVGTAVRAAGGGTIVEVKEEITGGKTIRITHPNGYQTIYGNTSDVKAELGEKVPAGAVIALSGNVGRLTIPHLHFELWHGEAALDPMSILKQGH